MGPLRSMRAKALVLVLLPVTVVLGNLAAASWFDHVNHRAHQQLLRAQQVLVTTASLQAALVGVEADAGTYLIEHRPADQQRFRAAAAPIPARLHQLGDEAGTDRRLRAAVSRAVTDMTRLLQVSNALVTMPGSTTTHADVPVLAVLDARTTEDMAALQRRVAADVAADQASLSSSGTDLVVVGAVAAAATLLGGIGGSLLFAGRAVRRIRQVEEATAALAAGKPPGPLPTGDDELGRLGRQLLETATRLRQQDATNEQARANLDAILAASPLVSFRYDTGRRAVVYASPNLQATFGVTPEEVRADTSVLIDRFHPDDVVWFSARARAAVEAGPGPASEHLLRFRRRGEEEWREARVIIATIADAAEEGRRNLVAYVVDVTERMRAERAADERRNLLESIFDASPDIIVVRDEADTVVLASSQIVDALRVPLPVDAAAAPAAIHGNLSPRDQQRLADLVARCRRGDDTVDPVVTTTTGAGGDAHIYETRARPVLADDGRVTGTVTITREITDRVQLEESLRRASESAEAASTAKSEFLSRMSHELRTPLNAILGFAQLLELDELPLEQAEFVDQIQRAGQHLLSLINEILDISRIESGHLSLSVEPVEVDALMAEVAALLTPAAEAARVQLQLATEATAGLHVLGDRQRLLQVLLNLGSNAVKYNRPDGLAVFHTTLEADGWVRVAVTDTGPGIPPERRTELFVPFSRLGADRSDVEGTGVGLALSKHLVELMGGTIGVTSAPGRGSTFWIELCQAEAPAAVPGAVAGSAWDDDGTPDDGGRRVPTAAAGRAPGRGPAPAATDDGAGEDPVPLVVLHVEDNESNAALVAQVLARRRGVQLLYAGQARTALELASRHRPDLILLDLHLPDLPGDEFLHRLRADPDIADTRVVAVSADATPDRIRRMLALGVEAYLTKPIDVPSLLRLVDLVRAGRPVPRDPVAHRRVDTPSGPSGSQGPATRPEEHGPMP